jgi:hypothetical protein
MSQPGRMRLRPGRIVRLVLVAGAVGTAVARAATPPAASVYPPPVHARAAGALAACPNPAGLERFSATSRSLAVQIAAGFGRTRLAADLRHSDRAWWPAVHRAWRTGRPDQGMPSEAVRGTALGADMFQSDVARNSCGSGLVADSLDVVIGPRNLRGSNDLTTNLVFVNRRGRPLVYWIH